MSSISERSFIGQKDKIEGRKVKERERRLQGLSVIKLRRVLGRRRLTLTG